ncbi:MAG: 4-hydroxy-tetrahydrodipicolinate synthase [Hyphomicrobiaceae bacterium]
MFKGSIPALITPFDQSGNVDEDAFARFVEWQIAQGSHGLVPVGTTGESPTVTEEEHKRLFAICVEVARKRVPVIAGAGSNSTAEAIEYSRYAKDVGADAVLIVMPYYNKPTQEGMFLHVKAINDAVDIPIVLYNVPARTVADIMPATIARCAKLKNVVGIKDATANMARASLERQLCGEEFCLLSGEDATALGFNAHGGTGCISVTANVAPALCAEFQEATLRGDFKAALALQDRLMPLHEALFVETSPGPVKYAVSKLGFCRPDARLPLAPITEPTKRLVDEAMVHAGLTQARAAE